MTNSMEKKTLKSIFQHFPNVEKVFNGKRVPLTNVEDVFYQFSLFVSDPDKYSFNINLFYKYLREEELNLGIQFLIEFFQKDTYLLKEKREAFTIKTEDDPLLNQTMFAKYLADKGLNFDAVKVSTYYRRKLKSPRSSFPMHDLEVSGVPYWYESTAERFAKDQMQKQNQKEQGSKNSNSKKKENGGK